MDDESADFIANAIAVKLFFEFPDEDADDLGCILDQIIAEIQTNE